ncbi:hypothetical protein FHL05_06235 [Lactobacillus halodurans]|uniref:Uncharacterized protein n=2 Tax=Companilactobacillus halodurans TaxID=2584183 RepID=A0A5P0ZXG4_9LACO|nr:hypothetical protein [Companilactobacillus halodurans]
MLFINDLIRKRMVYACRATLMDKDKIVQIAVDEKTADYLKSNSNQELYRVDDFISKEDDLIRYKLCLKKRSFDFYLEKKDFWNYKVVAIKMY